jgi:hypothetical protein
VSEWAYKWISFDMSREGLQELERVLNGWRPGSSEEFQNFHNEIRNMLERAPATLPLGGDASWLDE